MIVETKDKDFGNFFRTKSGRGDAKRSTLIDFLINGSKVIVRVVADEFSFLEIFNGGFRELTQLANFILEVCKGFAWVDLDLDYRL
jgi:hypothetical protein